MMRKCTVCKKTKTEAEYFYKNIKANKLHSQCKACYQAKRREFWKEHYHRYGDKYRERAIKRNKEQRDILKARMIEYLSDKSCVKCGMNDPRVLEFDHIDPETKVIDISKAFKNTMKWEDILLEIEKCQLLCANCHKIKTAEQNNWYRNSYT